MEAIREILEVIALVYLLRLSRRPRPEPPVVVSPTAPPHPRSKVVKVRPRAVGVVLLGLLLGAGAGAQVSTQPRVPSNCTDVQVIGGQADGTGVECQADATGTDSADDLSDNQIGDLSDVDETGADAGETLVSDGAGAWAPSAAQVCLEDGTNCPAGGSGDVVGPAPAVDLSVAAFDGTTGKLIQARDLTIADVSGASVAVATTPGNALALAATAPDAANGASQAGKAASITASPAVASLDTAGAAIGGSVTYTSGAAARNTSGNAKGGDHIFVVGAGVGTGTNGQVLVPQGNNAVSPPAAFVGDEDTGYGRAAANMFSIYAGASEGIRVAASDTTMFDRVAANPHAVTCTDTGTGALGALTITPTSNRVHVTNSDANGCDVTMGETNMVSGFTVEVIVVSNAGGTVNWADSAGVQEVPAGGYALALYDAATFGYISDRFVALGSVDN